MKTKTKRASSTKPKKVTVKFFINKTVLPGKILKEYEDKIFLK